MSTEHQKILLLNDQLRQNQQYSETEQKRNRLSKFGTNSVACVEKFHNSIKLGPVFVCTCCHQTWFHESVSNVENVSLEGEIKRTFFTQMKSVND